MLQILDFSLHRTLSLRRFASNHDRSAAPFSGNFCCNAQSAARVVCCSCEVDLDCACDTSDYNGI